MDYQHMKFSQLLKELNSEEKARMWVWLAKFDGKEFVCPQYHHEASQAGLRAAPCRKITGVSSRESLFA